MARPTFISAVAIAQGTSATPGAVAIPGGVPSDAEGAILFFGGYQTGAVGLTGLSGNFTGTWTFQSIPATGSGDMAAAGFARVTSHPGSETYTPVFDDSFGAGPAAIIAFYKDIPPSGDWVLGLDVKNEDNFVVEVDSNADCDVLFFSSNEGGIPSALSGWTSRETQDVNGVATRASTLTATPGSPTTSQSGLGAGYPTGALISVLGITGGGPTTHDSAGDLVGPGSTVAGTAARNSAHSSSGALTGPGSAVVGSAARTRAHASTGDLTGPGSSISGAAARTRAHPSSGALTGPGSVVDGAAARTRQHASSGDLTGPGSAIVGSADHQGAAGVHDSSGALVGQGSTVAGNAARTRAFAASGALVGPGSIVVGTANHIGPAVSHNATGALVGPGAVVAGAARHGGADPEEVTPTYVVGKKTKPKERRLMGGPRWERHELEDLAKVVQTRPYEEVRAEAQAREVVAKATQLAQIEALAIEAEAQMALSAQELTQARQVELSIQQIEQQLEDEAVMKIIAEML